MKTDGSESRNQLLAPFVELGFETSARRGNLLRLEWKDVTLVPRIALLHGMENSRNPNKIINHTIDLIPRVVKLPNTYERVLPTASNAMRKAFNRAREKDQARVTH